MNAKPDRKAEPRSPQPDAERPGDDPPDGTADAPQDTSVAIPVDAEIAASVLAEEPLVPARRDEERDVEPADER